MDHLRATEEDTVVPLSAPVAGPITRSLGADVSAVRVHTGPAAAAAAGRHDARAFAHGHDVYLGPEERPADLGLMAHEVAHVIQQETRPRVPLFGAGPGQPGTLEREARAAASAVMRGERATVTGRSGGQLVQRQQRGPGAAPPAATSRADASAIVAAQAFNLIMSNDFPGPSRGWYSGFRIGPADRSVSADLAGSRDGYARFVVGDHFATDTRTETLAARVPDVRAELARVLAWRLGLGIVTAADLTIPMVSDALRAMRPTELRALAVRDRVEAPARDEINRILAISTVLPSAAQIGRDGTATLQLGGVTVRILPDRRAGNANETAFRLVPDRVQTPATTAGRDGRIARIRGPMPVVPSVEIQTTYAARGAQAAGDPATTTSAYGRGTTPADRAAGDTSLRLHESSHGADFLQYISTHSYRPFAGHVGMTRREWNAEQRDFLRAHAAWAREMGRFSVCRTDCVGAATIDDLHRGEHGYQLQCRGCGS